MPLESIVRPFQRPDRLATRRLIAASTKIDVGEAVISWGKAGTIPGATQIDEPDEDSSFSFTVKDCDEGFQELSRKVTPIRIEQEGVPENFVIFNRIDEMKMTKDTKPKESNTTNWVSYVEIALANSTTTTWRTAFDDYFGCRNTFRFRPS